MDGTKADCFLTAAQKQKAQRMVLKKDCYSAEKTASTMAQRMVLTKDCYSVEKTASTMAQRTVLTKDCYCYSVETRAQMKAQTMAQSSVQSSVQSSAQTKAGKYHIFARSIISGLLRNKGGRTLEQLTSSDG